MARITRIAFDGVQGRDLSRHLRANGCKVSIDDRLYDTMTVRSDKSADQLKQLAMQLPGCQVHVEPVSR